MITGMPPEERELTTALSLGGNAAKIARSFPHALFADQYGLPRLIAAL